MNKLYLVTTPLGNIEDISDRVRNSLKEARQIVAEDTRKLKALLSALGIDYKGKSIESFHDQSHDNKLQLVLRNLGKDDVYYVSEAGSPIISDPAFPLVKLALNNGYDIRSFPGPTSLICALELSGLPPHPFSFYGFPPRENDKKRKAFRDLKAGTNIFFESPHRILKTVDILVEEFPESQIVLGRELTKEFETIHRFDASSWEDEKEKVRVQGEFVLLIYIAKKDEQNFEEDALKELALEYLEKKSSKTLSKLIAKVLDEKPKTIYNKIIE